ncbi:MAG: NTP transferase domain-containing protein [FCB group bacterium]|nr:NTP transferase domain-containing protein [FCB group bacterium]
MKVVIPVAGVGTRLKPHTLTTPKPLLSVAGKTILDYLLVPLKELNPEEVIFVIGYKGEMIENYVRDNYSFKSSFVKQDKLLGLGYAIHLALEKVGDEPLMVILGDTIVECNLKKFITVGDYTLGLRHVEDPNRFGIAEIKEGFVIDVEEKPVNPKTDLALIGLYYFKNPLLLNNELQQVVKSGVITNGEIQLTDAIKKMVEKGVKFVPFEVKEWYDCGKKETLLATNRHFLKRMPSAQERKGAHIIPPVFIGQDVRLEKTVIGPNVSIADHTVIKNTILSNSIIGKNSWLENLILEESIIGNDVTLKGGKRIVNIGDATEIESY